MKFAKYHGLGNDYIVIAPQELTKKLTTAQIRVLCHRNYGLGSDGILLGPLDSDACNFGLRIFNPDGSEAEKSGNGLRIFARYLWEQGLVKSKPFTIETPGGKVTAKVQRGGKQVTVDMGFVSFDSKKIPVAGDRREVLNETLTFGSVDLTFCAATIGNPHCVVLREEAKEVEAKKWGPLIETEPRFPYRTNVQFMQVLDRHNIRIEIWERGAGYTLASGSSASASAAVAHKLGLCDRNITVHMPGGKLQITMNEEFFVTMTGPVTKVAEGDVSKEMFTWKFY